MKLILLFSLLLTLVACENHYKDADKFAKILSGQSGQGHTVAKYWTQAGTGEYAVFKNEVTGEYSAYNLENFDRKKMTTYDAYLAIADSNDIVRNLEARSEWVESGYWYSYENSWQVCDSEGYCQWYSETVYTNDWIDTSGYVWFYYGGGFRFENTTAPSRDLETMAALGEEATINFMTAKISSDYALSESRAEEMAKLALRYRKLESSRELTAAEKNIFALEALGVSYAKVEASMKDRASGDEASYQEMLEAAAKVNRTTPESIGKFFNDFIAE